MDFSEQTSVKFLSKYKKKNPTFLRNYIWISRLQKSGSYHSGLDVLTVDM